MHSSIAVIFCSRDLGAQFPSVSSSSILYDLFIYEGRTDEGLDSDDLEDDDDDDEDDDDDDDDDEDDEKSEDVKVFFGSQGEKETETLDNLRKYMDQMDHELMDTHIGKSFNQKVMISSSLP